MTRFVPESPQRSLRTSLGTYISALWLLVFMLSSVSFSSAATHTVNISNFAFTDTVSNNSTTVINAGDTVQWNWQSGTHSTTSGTCSGPGTCTASGTWDSTILSSPNTFSFTFNNDGSFPYYCRVHTTAMLAKVIVNPVVTNTNDSGPGSLRQAILDVNANPDLTTITFNIPGGGVQTIAPTSALPAITNPVVIDGYTQPGAAPNTLTTGDNANLLIEINGSSAGSGVNGLIVAAPNVAVHGLVINRFKGAGIAVRGSSDSISGNFVGTDATGATALGNGADGIFVSSAGNTIGGTSLAARNIISGNSLSGIEINGATTNANVIEGNYIGLDATGTTAIANGSGIAVFAVTSGNTIGGTTAGAGNVISGNVGLGIEIFGSGASNNSIQGNFIGTNAAGTASVGNGTSGILLLRAASSNLIGGVTAAARNIIAGNKTFGIQISDIDTNVNLIEGNYIGTDVTGGIALPNKSNGVEIQGSAQMNTVGGTSAGAGNVISGNTGAGIGFSDSGTSNNLVYGNLIGTNPAGTSAVPNNIGVLFVNNSGGNVVGGPEPGAARNIISGNTTAGVSMNTVPGNVIAGNYIGTDITGTSALSNNVGIFLDRNETLGSLIGGTAPGEGNVISGNSTAGIEMSGAGSNNLVEGNFIGTNAAGTAGVANGIGVYLTGGAFQNIIGGISAGTRNVISGNSNAGILVDNLSTTNFIEGNLIGTDATGTVAVGNSDGVLLKTPAEIGNTVAGAGNIISGNVHGVAISANGVYVQGNLIGTDITGTAAVGNQIGVYIATGTGNVIGGTTVSAVNVISGNTSYGVNITGAGTTANLVQGNLIGTDVHGTAPLANLVEGVRIDSGSAGNMIGGIGAGAGNNIAYNPKGVVVVGNTSTGNAIESNSIFSNTALGIDLNDDGVTSNSPGGPHTGPNDLQNYPVLTGVVFGGNNVTVHGTLNSAANTAFRLEFFSNPACDPSGHGQGGSFLGFQNVNTDGSGNAIFNASFSSTNAQVSATATDPAGNTSEFSACGQPDYALTNVTGRNLHVRLGKPFTFVVASFTDTDPSGSASQFSTTTIDWGDGTTPSTATIVSTGGQNYNVVGTHAYTKVGGWNVTVTINDSGGATVTAISKARLWPKPLLY